MEMEEHLRYSLLMMIKIVKIHDRNGRTSKILFANDD